MPNERIEDLQCGGLKIIQSADEFRFGMDAVLLTAFCRVKPGEAVLDLGTGTGVIPLLLSAKTHARSIAGLEISETAAGMAGRSVEMNNLSGRVRIIQGDIRDIRRLWPAGTVNVAVSNPPYIKASQGVNNKTAALSCARHEIFCTLDDVFDAAAWVLRPNGRFYLAHRPDRLADIMCAARARRLEPKTLRTVQVRAGMPPYLLLAEFVKCARPGLRCPAPLIVYGGDGQLTAELRRIYGNG